MDENFSKIRIQIEAIKNIKAAENWGPEYSLWLKRTEKLVHEVFGDEGLELFNEQRTMTTSYMDEDFNRHQYLKELENRKKILEGLMADVEEHQSINNGTDASGSILKEIWKKEEALKENLLTTEEAESLHKSLLSHLKETLPSDSMPGLRFRKLQSGKPMTWWSNSGGFPTDNPWAKFQPYLDLLSQYEAEKTIKRRLEIEGLFIESRSQGEDGDLHLLVGKRDGTGEKAHLIFGSKTGEIRTKDNGQEPTELVASIEAVLTLPSGKKVKTTREAIEEMSDVSPMQVLPRPRIDIESSFGVSGGAEGNFIMFKVKNDGAEPAMDIQYEITADDLKENSRIQITHRLSPQEISPEMVYRYTNSDLYKRKLSNPKILFIYKSADGRQFTSGRKLTQDKRADGNFNVHSRPGEYFE